MFCEDIKTPGKTIPRQARDYKMLFYWGRLRAILKPVFNVTDLALHLLVMIQRQPFGQNLLPFHQVLLLS